MNPDFSLSVPFVIGAIKNNIGKALITLLATLTLCALAIIFLPRSYLSEAIVFVRLGRESVSLDPTATTGSTVQVLESRESEVNSIRDMLQSRAILEAVVDTMGPEVVLGDADLPAEFTHTKIAPEDDVERSPRQQAIKMLWQEIFVYSERKSSVLKVGVRASSPQLAQRILQVYLDCYQTMHTNAHQTPESNEFFANQSTVLRTQWKELMLKLQESKKEAGVVSIEGAQDVLKAQMVETQTQLMEAESQIKSTNAKLKKLEQNSENPLNFKKLRDLVLETGASLASMEAESDILKAQMEELQGSSTRLNNNEVKIRQLEQEVAVAESNYSQYRELHEQTRIEAALLSGKFTNVKIIQDPSFIPKAVSPRKRIIAAAGLFAGFTGAFLVAIFSEIFYGRSSSPSSARFGSPSNAGRRESHEMIPNANA